MTKPVFNKEISQELFYRYFSDSDFTLLSAHFFSNSEFSAQAFWEDEESVEAFFRLVLLGGLMANEMIDINQRPDLLTVKYNGKSIGSLTAIRFSYLNEFEGPTFKTSVEGFKLEKLKDFFKNTQIDWSSFFIDLRSLLEKVYWKNHSMNIYSKEGSKLIYLGKNGEDYEREKANLFLKKGETYTVDRIDLHRSFSLVYLKEFPGMRFNTVMFRNRRFLD